MRVLGLVLWLRVSVVAGCGRVLHGRATLVRPGAQGVAVRSLPT